MLRKKITQSSCLNIFASSYCIHKRGKTFSISESRKFYQILHTINLYVSQKFSRNCTDHIVHKWLLAGLRTYEKGFQKTW